MRLHLVTVEGAERFEEEWTISPLVPLRILPSDLMMPMAGDDVELALPDGRVLAAQIVSFGVSVWRDSDGNFVTSADLSDPSLTLTITITNDSDLSEIPVGTDIWLSDAKTSAESDTP